MIVKSEIDFRQKKSLSSGWYLIQSAYGSCLGGDRRRIGSFLLCLKEFDVADDQVSGLVEGDF